MAKKELEICAGIVLYNPDVGLLRKNVEALYNQVDQILFYDNGSMNLTEVKNEFSSYKKITFKGTDENKGIAFALNRIVEWAMTNNFKWVLTMDQDSICANNLIQKYSEYISNSRVALISPFILNNGKVSLKEYKKIKLPKVSKILDPVDCITSGCLTNVEIVKRLGGFNDKLFIDCVDFDLNCKVLEAGYEILRVNDTYLIQKMGKMKKIHLFDKLQHLTKIRVFRRAKVVAVYPDKRLYYYARNTRYLRKTYKNHSKRTSAPFVFLYFLYFSIFYPKDRNRIKMWKSMIRGWKDYSILMK